MVRVRLAEYQIRLLLCTPAERHGACLYWKCGCIAAACGYRKYAVEPCGDHGPLLAEVREDEEPLYDWLTAPALLSPHGRLV